MEVLQFQPQTKITAKTWRGDVYDLTNELYSWTRSKSMSSGTFTISLVPRKDSKGLTWADKLQAMDYIEIRASKNGTKTNGELPIIMRGFLDGPLKSVQMPQQGGPSEPRITLSGQDYTKVLNAWQILYLFTQNTVYGGKNSNIKQIAAQYAGKGLYANFNVSLSSASINAFMESIFKNVVSPAFKGLKSHNYPSLPNFTARFDYPAYPVNGLTIATYTGSLYNLLQYVSSPPFGELFIRDEEEGAVLIGRMSPYKTITGDIPKPGIKVSNYGDIQGIMSMNVQQTDQDLYTYFLTWAADAQIVGPTTMPMFLPGESNGVLTDKSTLYGINPLEIDTPWISLFSASNVAMKDASNLNAWLIATMGDNHLFWNGTVTCHGDESLLIGTYRTIPFTNEEYYISQINDSYMYATNTWTANLQIVRGRSLA